MARIVIPQRTLAAGVQGNIATNRVASTTDRYFLTIKQVSWPFTGGRALFLSMGYSADDGDTWQEISTFDVDDVHQGGYTFKGFILPTDTFIATVPIPDVGRANRRLRLSWDVLKPITVSGSIDSLQPGDSIPLERV